ncbi:MAG TPA: hypothetical protein VM388_05260 [Acidimicrobiales bacterium]|nr:hypothetical protein [Acidimicrobiales bacterium]
MDRAVPEESGVTRWLAYAVGVLVVAGLVSAGTVAAQDDRPSRAVTATAESQGTVDVTSTVTIPLQPPPPPSTPPPTAQTSTTVPRAAVDVLNALAGSTTTTPPRATTTTRPPAPTTTVPTPTTAAPAITSTTVPRFTANFVNEHPNRVVLNVNGQSFPLMPTQTVEVDLPMSVRGDVVQVRLAEESSCGVTDSGEIFKAGSRYQIRILVDDIMCKDFTRPRLEIARR